MKRFIFAFFISLALVFGVSLLSSGFFLLVPTKMELDKEKLIKPSDFTAFYDRRNSFVAYISKNEASFEKEFKDEIKLVFTEAEDRNFYSHSGLDFKRMIKAAAVNIFSCSFKQGASTISQQLVKNTLLTNEKTIERKLKEIKLAQKLEENYSKEEIITAYLNVIYFGEGCFGLPAAASVYFNKKPSDLSLAETALLASIIPSPSSTNPFVAPSAAKKKRDGLLLTLLQRGKITQAQYEQARKESIPQKKEKQADATACYAREVFKEANEKCANPYLLKNAKIYTYFDKIAQDAAVLNAVKEYEYQAIAVDNATLGIAAYFSSCGDKSIDPASTVKPFLVYAPAIENGIITPYTFLEDEKRSFNGYEPSNYNDEYLGCVSATTALKKSLNTPAVTVYEWTGIKKCNEFAKRIGVNVQGEHYSAALGSIGGASLKDVSGAYASFANLGLYKKPRFIKKIISENGKTIYTADDDFQRAFSKGTATLVTKMLEECANSGTAKKLGAEGFPVAAKTGTAGGKTGNTDALCVAYTPSYTVAAWLGRQDKLLPNSITGGGLPSAAAADILSKINDGRSFKTEGVVSVKIDKLSYEKDKELLVCPSGVPERYSFDAYFLPEYSPKKTSTRLSNPEAKVELKKKNGKVYFKILAEPYINVLIYDDKDKLIRSGKTDFSVALPKSVTAYYYVAETEWGVKSEKRLAGVVCDDEDKPSIPEEWWRE